MNTKNSIKNKETTDAFKKWVNTFFKNENILISKNTVEEIKRLIVNNMINNK